MGNAVGPFTCEGAADASDVVVPNEVSKARALDCPPKASSKEIALTALPFDPDWAGGALGPALKASSKENGLVS